MKHQFHHEKLEVWQKSLTMTKSIYTATDSFPKEERFGLTSQLRRAAVSVMSNIAEGNSRFSKREKARFFEISYGSLVEILCQLAVSEELGLISETEHNQLRSQTEEISRMLNAIHKSNRPNRS